MLETSSDPLLSPKKIDSASYPSLKQTGVLVTGGASGIGMYLVEAFARQGARVGFVDIDADSGSRVADAVDRGTGNRPEFEQCDLTDIASLTDAVGSLRKKIGRITVLINNAGNDDRLPFEEITPEYWDERQSVNFRHHVFASQAVVPDMKEAGGGSIVSMGSNSWMQGAPGLLAYTTAKSSVQGFVRCLATELGSFGIRVNAIAPGWILTDRQVSRAREEMSYKFDEYKSKQAIKEFLLPPDVARMALFLSAEDSRMITGQTIIVDGGVI